MRLMNGNSATRAAPVRKNIEAQSWRAAGWIAVSLALFIVLLLGTLFVASRLTTDWGIAYPEREHFAAIQALLLGFRSSSASRSLAGCSARCVRGRGPE